MLENYSITKTCCFELAPSWGNIDNYLSFSLYIVLFCHRWCHKRVILWLIPFTLLESLAHIFKPNRITFKLRIGPSPDTEVLFSKDEITPNRSHVWSFPRKALVLSGNWFCYYTTNCSLSYITIELKLKAQNSGSSLSRQNCMMCSNTAENQVVAFKQSGIPWLLRKFVCWLWRHIISDWIDSCMRSVILFWYIMMKPLSFLPRKSKTKQKRPGYF